MKATARLLTFALLSVAGVANAANSSNVPCVALYTMTKSYVDAALDAATQMSNSDVTSISANRNGNTVIADIEFTNGKKTKLQVDQECGGKLTVKKAKPAFQFQCRQWVNCEIVIGEESEKAIERAAYCSQDYKEWAKANCGYEPSVVQ